VGPGSLLADVLLILGVVAASLGYVFGVDATRSLPGWQVVSWVVVAALPITIPVSAYLWLFADGVRSPDGTQWSALVVLGLSSMYLGFFAWYRGLSQAGTAYGGQVQQLQVLLSLLWSALLLGEAVTWVTILAAAGGRRCGGLGATIAREEPDRRARGIIKVIVRAIGT
jgi:drug/metabolite transporter (DMT)-like permease